MTCDVCERDNPTEDVNGVEACSECRDKRPAEIYQLLRRFR